MKQRHKQGDKTLEMNAIQRMIYLVEQYELTKAGNHPSYRFVTDFYNAHDLKRQNFIKYYNRYKQSKDSGLLIPQKRGPRYKTGRTHPMIERRVINLRKQGLNRYEIFVNLGLKMVNNVPSPSTIYQIFKRHNRNKLKPKMAQKKVRRIMKTMAGELGHIDCHYLPKGMIEGDSKRYYLLGIIDSCTRVAWCELIPDTQSLTVMFTALKSLNFLNTQYNIQFKEILSDNGSEFGGKKELKNKDTNPFERLLQEMGIKHRYTRPYRPQTNGKIERFWRTIQYDLLDGMVFDSKEHFINEIQQYMIYYNEERIHQGLNGKVPYTFRQSLNA